MSTMTPVTTTEAPPTVSSAPVEPVAVSAVRSRFFPRLVFGLTFALLLSDYMSRQVHAAVFPFLNSEWGLSDTALGTLNSVVSIAVGLLAVPLSVLGDRFGRARAIIAMAGVWILATLGSA